MATPAAPPRPWADVIALDARSLGAFRIGFGVWLLWDLLNRSLVLTDLFSDAGVLPRADRIAVYDRPEADHRYWLSLLMVVGDPLLVKGFFALAAAAYTCLAAGYRTRTAAVCSYVALCSLHGRTPPCGDGAEDLSRVLLFWGLFLPLGGRFSLDVRLGRRTPEPDRVCSFATFAYLFQLGSVYVVGAILKSHPVWHTDYSALYYALNVDAFATGFGRWLSQLYPVTQGLTAVTFWLEFVGPLLLVMPWRTPWLRLGVAGAFMGFHLGTGLCLHLGLFPLLGMLAWVPLLPAMVWRTPPVPGVSAKPGRGALGFLVAIWALVLVWNLREVNPGLRTVVPDFVTPAVRLLRLDQNWALFAPRPLIDDGWFVMRGRLADGREVNLWDHAAPITDAKPADVAATYPGTRWRKYLLNLGTEEFAAVRPGFSRWLVRRWEDTHPGDEVTAVQVVFVREPTPPPGRPPITPEPLTIIDGRKGP